MTEKMSTAELLALTGFTNPYLYQLENTGLIRRSGRDQWPANTVHTIIQHLRAENRRGRRSEAADKLATIRAEALALRTRREAGELIPTSEVTEVLKAIVGEIVARLVGLPARFSRDIVERARLESLINEVRIAIADLLETEAARLDLNLGQPFNSKSFSHDHNGKHNTSAAHQSK